MRAAREFGCRPPAGFRGHLELFADTGLLTQLIDANAVTDMNAVNRGFDVPGGNAVIDAKAPLIVDCTTQAGVTDTETTEVYIATAALSEDRDRPNQDERKSALHQQHGRHTGIHR